MNQVAFSNPFSSRFIRPGATPFIFPPGEDIGAIVGRLRSYGWWGEIVGPHGSGKSTLLAALMPAMEAERPRVVSFALHDGQRRLPMSLPELSSKFPGGPQLLVVDGYEQLGLWHRWRLRRWCRRNDCGLLVTSHAPMGLPRLLRTTTDEELAIRVARYLLPPDDPFVTDNDVRRCFAEHGGNLRETLFALYGVYERRRKAANNVLTGAR